MAANPSETLLDLATYFQNYFIKYYMAGTTMFNGPLGVLGGAQMSKAFIIIALNDLPNGLGTTPVPMALDGTSVLNMIWNDTNTTYSLNGQVLELEGNPPISFTATVSN